MPEFVKTPRFIIGTIVVLWVAFVIYANLDPQGVKFKLFPGIELQFKLSTVIIGSAVFGAMATLVIQWLWRRPSNKMSSVTAPTPPPAPRVPPAAPPVSPSTKTVA